MKNNNQPNYLSDQQLQWLRRVGMVILLLGVFVPFDLLAILALLLVGGYFCIRMGVYLRR